MCKNGGIDSVEDLLGRPLFKMGFLEFFKNMQEEGFNAARNYWDSSKGRDFFIPDATRLFEKLIDFYILLGFVPLRRYEEVVEENAKLKDENNSLRNTLGVSENNIFPSLAHNATHNAREPLQECAGKQMGVAGIQQ